MTVTIRDVATKAGVSVATVSRALNHSGPVRDETRQRIEAAARALRYRPNSAARSLITRRTRMLGVLLPDLYGEFFSELIRGVDEAAQAEGYHLLLSSSHDDASELEVALHGMHGRVDGLVVMAPKVEARVLEKLLPHNVPVVMLNSADGGHGCGWLRIDGWGGARAMVAHLIGHGHRRIGMINGPERNFDAEERLRGYRSALKDAGLPPDDGVCVAGDFTGPAGYDGAVALMALAEPPTAIFAANDAMAIGVLSALRSAGWNVPEEVAVAGFDDLASAQYALPALTTVRGEVSELGAEAVAAVARHIATEGSAARVRRTLPASLVLRQSCGCRVAARARVRVEDTEPNPLHHQEVVP